MASLIGAVIITLSLSIGLNRRTLIRIRLFRFLFGMAALMVAFPFSIAPVGPKALGDLTPFIVTGAILAILSIIWLDMSRCVQIILNT